MCIIILVPRSYHMIKIYKHTLTFLACSSTVIHLHIHTQLQVTNRIYLEPTKNIGIFVVLYTREYVEIRGILSCQVLQKKVGFIVIFMIVKQIYNDTIIEQQNCSKLTACS